MPEIARDSSGCGEPLARLSESTREHPRAPEITRDHRRLGEPLAVAGAWQFYDGPTFHAMLHAARRGAARLRLLRGDALLAGLLAALGPLASGSDDAARLGETCAEAARLWAEAGATLG